MGLARRSRAASDGVPSTVVMHCPHKVAAGGRRCADPRRDSLRQVSYRVVPVFAWTVATLSLVTEPGPVMNGRLPRGMRPYSLYRAKNMLIPDPRRYSCWSSAHHMVPAAIASRTSFERSKVPTLIVVLPICFRAAIVGEEPVGPRAMTVSIVGSAVRAAAIFCCAVTGSLRSTWRTVDLPGVKPSLKPLQRASRPALPTSWLMQIAFLPPAAAMRTPAALPATASSCPTWVRMPSFAYASEPEFAEITGMPAVTHWVTLGPSAVAAGSEITRPVGAFAQAASMSWPIFTMSKVSGAL